MADTIEPVEAEDTKRRNHPELLVMGRIMRELEAMTPAAAKRVMAWLNAIVEENNAAVA